MTAEPQRRWTWDEYRAHERQAEIKSEFLNGEIFAMSGASRKHNLVAWNIVSALSPQIKKLGCEGYAGDMLVRIPATGLGTYPDLAIVCDEPQFEDDAEDTLLNPTLIIEVLSPSTEDYDHGKKFAHYRSLPSLRVYLLAAQDEVHVEIFERQGDNRWVLSETRDLEKTLDLPVIGATLALSDVYDRVPGI